MQNKSIWLSQWWVKKAIFIVNISDKTWSRLQDIIILISLMTLRLGTRSKCAKPSYLQQFLQFPVTSKHFKVQSQLFVNLLYLKYFEVFGRYLSIPVPKFPTSNTRPFALLLPSFLVQEGGINPERWVICRAVLVRPLHCKLIVLVQPCPVK